MGVGRVNGDDRDFHGSGVARPGSSAKLPRRWVSRAHIWRGYGAPYRPRTPHRSRSLRQPLVHTLCSSRPSSRDHPSMTCLVLGATGATGRLLVKELLDAGASVRIVVRDAARLDASLRGAPGLSVVEASISELNDDGIESLVAGCEAAASCLGHNLSFRGLFGPPYRLVTDATRRTCEALRAVEGDEPRRFVLMNTTGVRNPDLDDPVSLSQRLVILALRALLPPHADNEKAADYLRSEVGRSDPDLEWVAVRPDGLVDHAAVSEYDLHPSPTRSAIFDAGRTSRINVAHFMASLLTDPPLWDRWKGQTPVIYNASQP